MVDTVYVSTPSASGTRQRLLDATVELLGRKGPEGTSLREIARCAGVSHGAPLRHFPSLAALLSEVAALGFRQLKVSVDEAAAGLGASAGPLDRLGAAGRGYVRFALANPGVFALMWRVDLIDFGRPALAEAGPAAFATLTRLVEACQHEGWRAEADTVLLAGALWATVHGIAQLWLFGVLRATSGVPSVDAVTEAALALLLDPVSGRKGPPTRRSTTARVDRPAAS